MIVWYTNRHKRPEPHFHGAGESSGGKSKHGKLGNSLKAAPPDDKLGDSSS